MAKKKASFSAVIEKLGGMHIVRVPGAVSKKFAERQSVRIFCTLNDKIKYACALRPDGKGEFYINASTTILRKAKLALGQKTSVLIESDSTEFGHQFPEELTELLNIDADGKKYFEQLSNSQQRSIIYYINQAKSIDKRIERSLLFINRLKDTKGTWRPGGK